MMTCGRQLMHDKRLVVTSSLAYSFIFVIFPRRGPRRSARVGIQLWLTVGDPHDNKGFHRGTLNYVLFSYPHVVRVHNPSPRLPLFLFQHRLRFMFPQLRTHPPPESRCSSFHDPSLLHFHQDRFGRRCLHRLANSYHAHRSVQAE